MSEDADSAYTRALTDCATLDDLRALMAQYSELAVDAAAVVATMTEADMAEFRRGLRQERKGRFAGEPWAKRFAAVLMPLPMMRVSEIKGRYHVPFAVALKRIKDLRPDLLAVESPGEIHTCAKCGPECSC
jgi:hypothetical protein